MEYFQLILFGVFALVAGIFLFGRLKYGSWTGAFLKGSIEQTYGEIQLAGGVASSQVLKVVELRDGNGQNDIFPWFKTCRANDRDGVFQHRFGILEGRRQSAFICGKRLWR